MDAPSYNTYVTVGAIERNLSTPVGVERAVQRCRETRVGKVILEAYRGGTVIPAETLRRLRDAFRAEGLATSGGLMPIHGDDFGKRAVGVEARCGFFCYSDAGTRRSIEAEIRKLARLFDEVIIDDALLTSCRCRQCDQARGGRDWADFRRDLMLTFSQRLVEAVHEENADAKLILKLPQYYDRYHRFGYDPVGQGQLYDGIWVGTETRDPTTLAYGYTEPYQPWFHVGWVRRCVGAKFQGAWYDYLDCDEQLFYEQAVTTTLTGPGQVTLFCYGEPMFAESGGMARRVARARDVLDRLARLAVDPVGVAAFRPARADGDGDLFIFDTLGMVGIPLAPVITLDRVLRNVIIPAHGAAEADTPARVVEILAGGGQVILTLNALCRMLDDDGLAEAFGYDPSGASVVPTSADGLAVGDEPIELQRPCRIAGDLAPRDADVPVWAVVGRCEGGSLRVPLVTVKRHPSGGRAVVWNVDGCRHADFPINERLNVPVRSSMLDLPQPVLDVLRNIALAPLGVAIRSPSRVAVFLFQQCLVLVNYTDDPASVEFDGFVPQLDGTLSDDQANTCTDDAVRLVPRSLLAVPLTRPLGAG